MAWKGPGCAVKGKGCRRKVLRPSARRVDWGLGGRGRRRLCVRRQDVPLQGVRLPGGRREIDPAGAPARAIRRVAVP